jgi:hypothetical protein
MDGLDVHRHDTDPFGIALGIHQIQFTEIRDHQIKDAKHGTLKAANAPDGGFVVTMHLSV